MRSRWRLKILFSGFCSSRQARARDWRLLILLSLTRRHIIWLLFVDVDQHNFPEKPASNISCRWCYFIQKYHYTNFLWALLFRNVINIKLSARRRLGLSMMMMLVEVWLENSPKTKTFRITAQKAIPFRDILQFHLLLLPPPSSSSKSACSPLNTKQHKRRRK